MDEDAATSWIESDAGEIPKVGIKELTFEAMRGLTSIGLLDVLWSTGLEIGVGPWS